MRKQSKYVKPSVVLIEFQDIMDETIGHSGDNNPLNAKRYDGKHGKGAGEAPTLQRYSVWEDE